MAGVLLQWIVGLSASWGMHGDVILVRVGVQGELFSLSFGSFLPVLTAKCCANRASCSRER